MLCRGLCVWCIRVWLPANFTPDIRFRATASVVVVTPALFFAWICH